LLTTRNGFENEFEDDDDDEEYDEDEQEELDEEGEINYWFRLNKPPRKIYIPKNSTNQTINYFFIENNLIGEREHETSEIELKPDGYRAELVGMNDYILELHRNTYTIVRDFCAFGEYRCKHCRRNWRSANSYPADGMKCGRGCSEDLVYAHTRTVKGGPRLTEGGGDHREDLCGRCRRLGYNCKNMYGGTVF